MSIKKLVLGTLLGAGALALTAGSASAYVACNGRGDCWHTTERYEYRPAFGVTVHDDNWRWGDRDHYRWREHAGRGYWGHNGVWLSF